MKEEQSDKLALKNKSSMHFTSINSKADTPMISIRNIN